MSKSTLGSGLDGRMDAEAMTETEHKRDSSGRELMTKSPQCQAEELGARPEGSGESKF